MKIMISGGWGYGNLGDDAILLATIKLLRQKHPHASIKVMTYNCKETTKATEGDDIDVVPSVHKYLSGKVLLKKFGVQQEDGGWRILGKNKFAEKISSRLTRKYISLAEELSYYKYLWLTRNLKAFPGYYEFQDIDLFLLSGGAYLNSSWPDSVYSHALELLMAKKWNVKSVLVGQSIGPFQTAKVRKVALAAIRLASHISVRDQKSWHELQSYGIDAAVSPDIALADVDFEFTRMPVISLIVNNDLSNENIYAVSRAMAELCMKLDMSVKVLVTRLWEPDLRKARILFSELNKMNVNVRLILPDSYRVLQSEIGSSRVVVSANLHGLVLGWRSGVPGVSLNRYGKFISFMEQTNQANRVLCCSEITAESLNKAIHDALQTSCHLKELQTNIAERIAINFHKSLDA